MTELVPDQHDVVVVTSRPAEAEGGGRRFVVEAPEAARAPELPSDLIHERDLVDRLQAAGFRLTMVGGGSRPEDVRRFYFRPS